MIALFVPDIMNPFFPELARAVEDVTRGHGYTFILCNTDDDIHTDIAYLNALQQKSVDGMISVCSTITTSSIQKSKVPALALDRIVSSDLPSIWVNNRDGAREAVQYLQATGCKQIAHISGPEEVSNTALRMQGYLDEVKNEHWFKPSYIQQGEYNPDRAMEETKKLLTKHPEIDGIFVANDLMGVGVLKAAKALHIKVPDDLSVISFDGIALGEMITPSLTTMAQPIYDLGARAAEMLIKRIKNPNQKIINEEIEVELIVRESTRARS